MTPESRSCAPSWAEAESDMDRQHREFLAQQALADYQQWAAPPSADRIAHGEAERQARGQHWEMPLRVLCGETEASRQAARQRARSRAALRTSRYQELVLQQASAEDGAARLRGLWMPSAQPLFGPRFSARRRHVPECPQSRDSDPKSL
eukprot:CAMPEP_0175248876 /NCGR_PEP_ID=MMETSP0093-20121207/34359_1 /TAXON_ID=311494 /ORGANISM="Alexandrium monilatum, Strain CCMP3105" /LENGTH=148 /DNA_ID=CAMNT_0016543095 /DNA_START=45 /DNA_END=488 /DNA_ORIENTATION=-